MRKALVPLLTIVCVWESTEFVLAIGRGRGLVPLTFPRLQTGLILATLFTLLVHEAGHLLAGRIVGWRCVRFRIGCCELVRKAAGWKLHWTRRGFSGGVVCVPSASVGFRQSNAFYTAGGPL